MEPQLSLALSMHSNPGVYALLLGSGVSRSAKIPTGWEVVLDLIGRVAAIKDGDVEGDPVGWYETEFGEEPDYSELLGRLARQRDERQALLRGYFEPTEDEREEGLKQPTDAHRAIASLCARGYVKVIVTTNFDRLVEQALRAEGVEPTVISTADAVKGSPPLAHTDVLVLKIHGDYLDTRIRNTTGELEQYPKALRDLLDRIFDEFGLVVSGWSARWDPALRAAIERCRNQRYTTYWTGLDEPDEELERLLTLRRAEFIQVEGADGFFRNLHDRVVALEEHARPHPLSVDTAIAALKRYLPEARHEIRCHDLLASEADRIRRELAGARFSFDGRVDRDRAVERVESYETVTEILRALVATTCFWAEERHLPVLTRIIEDLGAAPPQGGNTFLLDLRRYPALLLLYAGGIGAVANENWAALRALLMDPKIRSNNSTEPAAVALMKWGVLTDDHAQLLPGMERKKHALSQWLEKSLRDSTRPVISSDSRYQWAFDRFEYLWGLVYAHIDRSPRGEGGLRGPIGSFSWRSFYEGPSPAQAIEEEIASAGASWGPLQAGLFDGDLERLGTAKEGFDAFWRAGY